MSILVCPSLSLGSVVTICCILWRVRVAHYSNNQEKLSFKKSHLIIPKAYYVSAIRIYKLFTSLYHRSKIFPFMSIVFTLDIIRNIFRLNASGISQRLHILVTMYLFLYPGVKKRNEMLEKNVDRIRRNVFFPSTISFKRSKSNLLSTHWGRSRQDAVLMGQSLNF